MVFYHEIDPSYGDKEHQGKLQSIHNPSQVTSTDISNSLVNDGTENQEYCSTVKPSKISSMLIRC